MYSITYSNSKNITVRDNEWPGELRIVSFKVEDYVVARLDKLAEQLRTSRSELVRLGVAVILALFSDEERTKELFKQLEDLESRIIEEVDPH